MADGGEQRRAVTMRELADHIGLHQSTVSRALDPRQAHRVSAENRRLVIDAADELGFRPDLVAAGLRRRRTFTLGVVVSDLANLTMVRVFRAFTRVVEPEQFIPLIVESGEDSRRLERNLDHLISRRVEAILVMAARTADRPMLERYAAHIPLIVAVRHFEHTALPVIAADEPLGARLVADHLLGLGHRRITQLRGPDDVGTFQLRARSFSATCEAAGAEEIVVAEPARQPTTEEGERLVELLFARGGPPPTAIFAHNDLMAFGVLAALRRRGVRVPEDIALVGYNDSPVLDELATPLTSVEYPVDAIGEAAGRLALTLTENPAAVVPSSFFPPRLVIRASSGGMRGASA